ncbi:hypothetical protein [Sphingomonas sp. IBVSS2]|uniref:hypothetical protein n=1 Tax=Sphingomonas sp. IBVSS2 TaxID=1985172 RepID=UPI001181C27C|nr:hypothetical protein [Sphingomonas sp. IBVSS2]
MPRLEFSNNLGRRARVWLDDLPGDALLSNEAMREAHVFEGGPAIARRRRVAIEVFRPFGPSFHYGLLGGEYQATDGHELEVVVPIDTPFAERLYGDALAGSLDVVTIGGLPEYTGAICAGVEQVNIGARPSGVLNITCMAHGEIGSAPIMFSSLARALIVALCRSDQPSSLDEAMALLAA